MKILCEGLDLSEATLKVVKACSTKTTTPILECIKLSAKNDSLTLLAFDGEISIEKSIKAEVIEEGEITVPGKYFADFINKLTGEQVLLSSQNDKLAIKYADSQTFMQLLNSADFPKIDIDINENNFSIFQSDLKEIISKTIFCCAVDDSRPVLKGCLFEIKSGILSAVALDGYRMAVCKKPISFMSDDINIICPARTLSEISKMLKDETDNINVYIKKSTMLIKVEDTVITSRLYNGDFINKDNIIAKEYSTEIIVNKKQLEESVERASILARADKNNLVILDIKENSMTVKVDSEIGNVAESLKINLEGKDLNIALNSKYLLESLKNISDETLKMSFNTSVSPCILTSIDGNEFLYLILPVRTTA